MVLVRHGATAHSGENRFSGRNDLPLNEVGRAQAAALARRAFPGADAVLTSPLRRARETATTIADQLALPMSVVDGLAEVDFGTFEGLTADQARQLAGFAAWAASPENAPPGGESFAAAGARVEQARQAIVAEFAGATVVVVSHVTPIKLLIRATLAAPLDSIYRMYLDTASVSIIDELSDGSSALRLFNDTSHLRRADDQ